MVKKIIFLLTFLFIFNINVNASQMNLPTPTRICVDNTNGVTQCSTTITNATWSNNTYFTNTNFRLGDYGSGGNVYSSYNFQWVNQEFCLGKNILIKGTIAGLFDFFVDNTNWNIKGYNNGTEMSCSFAPVNSTFMNFTCSGIGGGSMIFTVNQESFPSSKLYEIGFSQTVDVSCDVSNGDIISSNEQNTQNIINSQNSNTQNIINNQNQNAQDIIDSHNQNAQDIIDNQNTNTDKEIESQKVCSNFVINKDSIVLPNSYLSDNGSVLSSSSGNGITDYYPIVSTTSISVVPPIPTHAQNGCFYNSSKTLISCFNQSSIPSIPVNANYIRFTVNSSNTDPRFSLSTCKNGNQALNDSVNDLNDTLKNDNPPDTENQLNDLESDLISDTPITDLITLPITLINAYISGFNGSCSPFNLGNLYGTDIIFPCLNLQQKLGSNLWSTIDGLFSIFMIYNIAMLMIQAFEGFTSLRDDYEGLYQPRHADLGYQPKHGGVN